MCCAADSREGYYITWEHEICDVNDKLRRQCSQLSPVRHFCVAQVDFGRISGMTVRFDARTRQSLTAGDESFEKEERLDVSEHA